ncbi:hypothetical protein Acr_05g0009390 [Actinidia rufa]|uniref:Retrotransposon gag domain-containing protein n=1 Tax=Actinidia rufa TaxID=165716 RepID=A0A7J0ELP3_9ERIC|nr:hypothetical protein Acr_05g0009390 [Actinidia rufa]
MNPPSFDGLGDLVVAGHWLSEIRKIFDTVRITEDDMKVSFASYQLVGEANEWWESIKEAKGVDRGMTWANFKSTFEDQYFPEAYRDELREQFEKLVQEDMTISEYAIKFQSLSRFAPDLPKNFEISLIYLIVQEGWSLKRSSAKSLRAVGSRGKCQWAPVLLPREVSTRRDKEITHRD